MTRDAAEYAERGTLVLLDSLSLLVIVTWTGHGAIVRDTFFIVDSIIDFSTSSKRIKFALVLGCIGFFEIAWQFVCTWLREFVEAFSYDVGGARPDAKRDGLIRQSRLHIILYLMVPIVMIIVNEKLLRRIEEL